jgi:hypothetical protein
VLELVARRWGDRTEGDRRNLAQVLLTLFEPLNDPGTPITDDLRAACEHLVADWVRHTVPAQHLVAGLRREVEASAQAVASRPRRRVRLSRADVARTADGKDVAQVTLEHADAGRKTAAVLCGPNDADRARAGAEATLEVIRRVLPADAPRVELAKVGMFEAFGGTGVIVAVNLIEADQRSSVVGVCPAAGAEFVRAAAVAVLNATNRRLGIG